MPTLLRDSHFVLEHYVAAAFVRLARTAAPLPSPAQVAASLAGCHGALGARDTAGLGILIDLRLAPPLSAAAPYEPLRAVAEFGAQFARRAVLLLTPAAPAALDPTTSLWPHHGFQLFQDEEAAIAHVAGA